jgi:hypothetical protein
VAITISEIVALFCFLIISVAFPLKKKKSKSTRPDKGTISNSYGINEAGELRNYLINKEKKKIFNTLNNNFPTFILYRI